MGPSRALARTWLRRNLAATVLLAALIAVLVASAGGAFAGARRTASSLDRFLEYNRPPDVQVFSVDGQPFDVAAVVALPEVVGWSTGTYGLLSAEGPGGGPFPPGDVNPFISIAGDGVRPFRPHVVEGRDADAQRADELTLDEEASRRLGAGVGDTVVLRMFLPEQMEELFAGGDFPEPRGERAEATVTGIVRHTFDVNPTKPDDVDAVALASSEVYPTIAFWQRYGSGMAAYGNGTDNVELLLADGAADVPAIEAAVSEIPGGQDLVVETANDAVTAAADARQTVRFEAIAMAMFGLLILLAGAVMVGQVIARQARAELGQRHVLGGIGLTRADIARAVAMRMAVVATTGAVLGVPLGWLTSAVTPLGFSRKAEVEPGLRFDALPLVGIAASVLFLVVAWSAWTGWRVRAETQSRRLGAAGRLAAAAGRAGAPVGMVAGLSQLTARGTRAPMRSALGGVVFALGALTAVGVYGASVNRFVDEPGEHGWTWDLMVGDSDDETLTASGTEILAGNDDIAGFASVWSGSENAVTVGGTEGGQTAIAAVESLAGDTYVHLTDGRAAVEADEVVLGARTMAAAGVDLGDEVVLEGPHGSGSYEVVGTAVLHQLVNDHFELDQGVVTVPSGLGPLFGDDTILSRFIVDVVEGSSVDGVAASLKDAFGPTVVPHVPPLDVASLRGTRNLPLALGAVVGVLGGASLFHLLIVTIRRRRREFAVIRTLGARRHQVTTAVASMATAMVVLAIAIGVPVGLVVGRFVWLALGGGIGAPTGPVIPGLLLVAVVVGVVVIGNLVAAVPAALARRLQPAEILRSE